jgi:hypothetical protein
MPTYVRVLGTQDALVSVDQLKTSIENEGLVAYFYTGTEGNAAEWENIGVTNEDSVEIMQIERLLVEPGSTAQHEIQHFLKKIDSAKPLSAADWLKEYLPSIKVIYRIALTDEAYNDDNYLLVNSVKETIWNLTGGIFQGDNEGFTNEEGYEILWQFADDAEGDWYMAVLDHDNDWISFKMDLGNTEQREQFWEGQLPEGVVRVMR